VLTENNYSIGNFITLYLGKDFRYLNNTLKTFINRIASYLKKLENPLSIITLRMSTLLTEEKLDELKNKLYREMNLIKEYSNMHVEAISSEVNNFIHLLSNESLIILNNTENFISQKVENLYDNLLKYIMSKFETKSVKFDNEDFKFLKIKI
jgi:hypothetical protein